MSLRRLAALVAVPLAHCVPVSTQISSSGLLRRDDPDVATSLLETKPDPRPWWEALPQRFKIHSQNDEDGIIESLLHRVGSSNKQYVEFGAEDGSECNTRRLREEKGWQGLTMDGGNENLRIGMHKEFITPANIAGLFQKYSVLKDVDLVSVDVDSFDAYVLRAILSAGYRPRILIVESNDHFGDSSYLSFPGDVSVTHTEMGPACGQVCSFKDPRDSGRKKTAFCGAGTRAVNLVASKGGYHLVHLNKVNMFFVRNDLLPEQMLKEWTFDRAMEQSKKLGRNKMSFPPGACSHLVDGLIDVRSELVN